MNIHFCLLYIGAQSETAVGHPVSVSLSNSGLPQKYILMSMLKYHTSKLCVYYLNRIFN